MITKDLIPEVGTNSFAIMETALGAGWLWRRRGWLRRRRLVGALVRRAAALAHRDAALPLGLLGAAGRLRGNGGNFMMVGRTGWGWRPFITMRHLVRLGDVTDPDRTGAAGRARSHYPSSRKYYSG